MGKRQLLFLLFTAMFLLANGQQTDWFVLNHGSHRFQMGGLDVDDLGNVYTFGSYWGKVKFTSSVENAKTQTAFTSEHWERNFITKHNSVGTLEYTIHISSAGSNTEYASVHWVKAISNQALAVVLTSTSGFRVSTASYDTVYRTRIRSTSVLYFDQEGNITDVSTLPNNNFIDAECTPDGSIYVLGSSRSFSAVQNQLFKVLPNHRDYEVVDGTPDNLTSIRFYNGAVWMMALNREKISYGPYRRYYADTYSLFSWIPGSTGTPVQEGSVKFGPCRSTNATLVRSGLEMRVVIVAASKDTVITANGDDFSFNRYETGVFFFNTNGKQLGMFRTGNFFQASGTIGTSDGGFVLQTTASDSLVINRKNVAQASKHGPNIQELFFVKLEPDFSPGTIIRAGGSLSTSRTPQIFADGNQLYSSVSCLDHAELDFGKVELLWKAGYYIRKFRL